MKKAIIVVLSALTFGCAHAQTYTPISVTGFNIDAVAESYPDAMATTTQALDQVVAGGNSVMYSAAFASAAGFTGGLPNTGTIVNANKTFQLQPYTVNNALFAPAASTRTLSLTTPASYSNLSFLVFSTEGSSSFNITLYYTDLSSTNAGNFTVQDWFNGSGAVISGIGRCKRFASGVTNDGVPSNPRLYGIDVPVSCINQQKLVSHIVVNGITSNSAGGGGYVLAVSGVTANVVPPIISYGTHQMCRGGAASTPTLTGAVGGTYASAPAGLSLNSANGVLNLSLSSSNTYTITYTTSGTCPSSTNYTIEVLPSPTVSINTSSICAGQTATLTASGADSYAWVGNNLSSTTGTVVNASIAATSVYTLTGTSNGCSSATTSTVSVIQLPVVTTNFDVICPGDPALLIATPSIPGGTYIWLPGNQTTSSITESPNTATNYTVTYTLDGCSASAIAAVNMKPVPSVSVRSESVCAGERFMLIANSSSTGGTFLWSPGGATTASISDIPQSATTYTVEYDLNGCKAQAVANVGIYPDPDAQVISSAPSAAPGDEVNIVASGGTNYLWSTGATSSAINVKPLETTTFCATVTSVYGCTSEACVEILVKDESTLYIPNVFTPNGDGINDEFSIFGYNLSSFDLRIFNRWGQLLFQTSDPSKGWDGSFRGEVIPGVYVFTLSASGNDGSSYKKSGHITLLQ